MKKTLFIYSVMILVILSSCKDGRGDCGGPGIQVYKLKGDYTQLAFISKDKDKYTNHLSASEFIHINGNDTIILDNSINLAEGYKSGVYGSLTVFLSLTWKDLWLMEKNQGRILTDKELVNYIYDENPFLEFYKDMNCPRLFSQDDTLKINDVIRNGELSKYFKRLK